MRIRAISLFGQLLGLWMGALGAQLFFRGAKRNHKLLYKYMWAATTVVYALSPEMCI